MSTGNPLGDFMLELLSPCEEVGQLIFDDAAIEKLKARFMKEAHGLDPEEAGGIVLTGIGFLNHTQQTYAAKQLIRALVDTVETVQNSMGDNRFQDFLGHVRNLEFSNDTETKGQKVRDVISLPTMIRG